MERGTKNGENPNLQEMLNMGSIWISKYVSTLEDRNFIEQIKAPISLEVVLAVEAQ